MADQDKPVSKCFGFRFGCTCGACQRIYFLLFANSCTYGKT